MTLDDEAIRVTGELDVAQARISIEQPASASIPTLPRACGASTSRTRRMRSGPWQQVAVAARPVQLDLKVKAPRRVVVVGRGLDTEWSTDLHIQGPIVNPEINGTATLIRGDLDLAGRRFAFDTGSINLDGPITQCAHRHLGGADGAGHRCARACDRLAGRAEVRAGIDACPAAGRDPRARAVRALGLASCRRSRRRSWRRAWRSWRAARRASIRPALVRQATGLDRIAFGASDGVATVSAGKYIAENVYVQVGAGSEGGIAAEVEWEPRENLSIISAAQDTGDTKISVRWKNDY